MSNVLLRFAAIIVVEYRRVCERLCYKLKNLSFSAEYEIYERVKYLSRESLFERLFVIDILST